MSNVPMTRPEEMLIEHKTAYFTSSTFAELDDGRILRQAYAEFSTSEDGGITWSEPFQRKDVEGNLVDGHALVKLSGRGIGLVGNLGKPPTPPHGETREQKAKRQAAGRAARVKGTGPYLVFWRSDDGGETWQSPVRIGPNGVGSFHNSIVRTSSGRLLMPVEYGIGQRHGFEPSKQPTTGRIVDGQFLGVSGHYFDPLFGAVYSVYSDDEGRTWDRNEDGDLIIMLDWSTTYSYVFEPTLAEAAPGVILMVMRTGLGRLFQAWSHDDGLTWTRPQPSPFAASTTPGAICSLPSTGHLLLIWNQESEEEVKLGLSRTCISAAISRNGGSIWEFFQNVESIHERTRVEPPPIRPLRPEEMIFQPGQGAPERDSRYIREGDFFGRWSYPTVTAFEDRVFITHSYTTFEPHPTKAEMVQRGGPRTMLQPGDFNGKLKVAPLSWFYGGKEPANNPFLPRVHDPALP